MSSSPQFFDTLIKLMNFGAAGVGVIVILFVFFIVMRGKPVDPGTLDLSKMLLRYGIGFAVTCGLLALVGPLLQPSPVNAPPTMLLSFSPSFASEKLPGPAITLPDGTEVSEGKQFLAQNGQMLVRMDDSLKAVKALKESVQVLAATASEAQKQADTAIQALAKEAPANAATQASLLEATDASRNSQATTNAIANSAARGDFAKLVTASSKLNEASVTSIRARADVIRRTAQ